MSEAHLYNPYDPPKLHLRSSNPLVRSSPTTLQAPPTTLQSCTYDPPICSWRDGRLTEQSPVVSHNFGLQTQMKQFLLATSLTRKMNQSGKKTSLLVSLTPSDSNRNSLKFGEWRHRKRVENNLVPLLTNRGFVVAKASTGLASLTTSGQVRTVYFIVLMELVMEIIASWALSEILLIHMVIVLAVLRFVSPSFPSYHFYSFSFLLVFFPFQFGSFSSICVQRVLFLSCFLTSFPSRRPPFCSDSLFPRLFFSYSLLPFTSSLFLIFSLPLSFSSLIDSYSPELILFLSHSFLVSLTLFYSLLLLCGFSHPVLL